MPDAPCSGEVALSQRAMVTLRNPTPAFTTGGVHGDVLRGHLSVRDERATR
jgi:hypothetical protein